MTKTSKHKARASDCAYAAELVRRYREKDPYRDPIGPGGPVVETVVDGDYLANELQRFAVHGTWDKTAQHITAETLARKNLIRGTVEHRRKVVGVTKAIDEAMEKSGRKEQTVVNALYRQPRARKK